MRGDMQVRFGGRYGKTYRRKAARRPVPSLRTSQGGSIIDLVMRMQGCSAYEAMAHLAKGKVTIPVSSSFHREVHTEQIRGEANNAPHCIFEGFMDFLSYLTMKGKEIAPCLVQNSVSNLSRAIAYLRENGIDSVRAFFDNDQAGRDTLLSLQSAGINVEDMSRHYSRYKDLNEYHVAQRTGQKQVIPPRKRGLRR